MMRRRRRPQREIAFGLDSFLDVITNVVGIVIRMILVVSVGARAYHAVQRTRPAARAAAPAPAAAKKISDPLSDEIAREQDELRRAQDRLLAQLRELPAVERKLQDTREQITVLASEQTKWKESGAKLEHALGTQKQSLATRSVTLADLQERGQKLREEIAALEKLPAPRKTIRYHAPVSRPVQTDEFLFECRAGRVTFVDITAFVNELQDNSEKLVEELRSQWQVEHFTRPSGAFRARYIVERQKSSVDQLFGGGDPDRQAAFRGGLRELIVEPLSERRGEDLKTALQPRSEFRQIVDFVDRRQAVMTFWVYPDSFPLFRQLRDYLYERQVEVAARPVPFGGRIGLSPRGSASRGQ
jgi:hypothetical protein